MRLSDRGKELLKALIDAGQSLPPRYKAMLFDQPHEAELICPGKTHEVTNVAQDRKREGEISVTRYVPKAPSEPQSKLF
jgi:hypothetical protein